MLRFELLSTLLVHILHTSREFSVFLKGAQILIYIDIYILVAFQRSDFLSLHPFLFPFTIVAHSSVYSLSKKAL